jgi:DNA polymerase
MDKSSALAKIAEDIKRCKVCKRDSIGKAVPGEGNPDAGVIFVGEAPGKKEAETGTPFVAQSGRVLDQLFARTGLNREDVFITSPVKYLPKRGTPTQQDIVHGRTHLLQQIDIIDPRIVVLMGRVAVRAVLGMDVVITREHGCIIERDGRTYFLTFHPAAVLHNPSLSKDLEEDFQKLQGILGQMRRQQ